MQPSSSSLSAHPEAYTASQLSQRTLIPIPPDQTQAGKKQKRKKRCAGCLDHSCSRAEDCNGSGGEKFCPCAHGGKRNKRAKR